jgi:hypothetical protein
VVPLVRDRPGPALNLWLNVVQLADKVAIAHESTNHQLTMPSSFEKMTCSFIEFSKLEAKRKHLHCQKTEAKKAEYIKQVKPLKSIIQDVTDDLHSAERSYNKAMMNRIAAGQGQSPCRMLNQVESLAIEVKQLVGSNLGSQGVDLNDPRISSLKADVARLLSDNHEIKASLGG